MNWDPQPYNQPLGFLRPTLSTLVSQRAITHRSFVAHVCNRLLELPLAFSDAHALSPPNQDGVVSDVCLGLVTTTRHIFSSKLAKEVLLP